MDLLAVSLPSSFCDTDTFSALFLPGLSLPSTGYPVLSTDIFTGSLWETFTIPATTYWIHISISWVTLMLNFLQLSFSHFFGIHEIHPCTDTRTCSSVGQSLYEQMTTLARHSWICTSHKMQRVFQFNYEHYDDTLSYPSTSIPALKILATSSSDQVFQTVNLILIVTLSKIADPFLMLRSLSYWSLSEGTDNYWTCI